MCPTKILNCPVITHPYMKTIYIFFIRGLDCSSFYDFTIGCGLWFMVFNVTFNSISVLYHTITSTTAPFLIGFWNCADTVFFVFHFINEYKTIFKDDRQNCCDIYSSKHGTVRQF
jgi:hypothetical protein